MTFAENSPVTVVTVPRPPKNVNVSRLPIKARDKLQRLKDEVSDRHAVYLAASEKSRAASDDLTAAKRELTRLETHRGIPPSKKDLDAARNAIQVAQSERNRREKIQDERNIALKTAQQVVGTLEEFLKTLPDDKVVKAFNGAEPKVRKTETVVEAKERATLQVAQMKARIKAVQSAPIPIEDAKHNMRQQVYALADQGAPDISRLRNGGSIKWPEDVGQSYRSMKADFGLDVPPKLLVAPALWCWFDTANVIEKLDAALDAAYVGEKPLSSEQRKNDERVFLEELLHLEREEEFYIEIANSQGSNFARRVDADPRAVLGIELR